MTRTRDRGEGSIYQTKKGVWRGAVSLPDGKRRYFQGRTRKEVAGQVARALVDLQNGVLLPPDKQTFGQFLTRWLEDVAKPSVRYSTYRSYEQLVRVHILPDAIAKKPIARLTPQDIQGFLNRKMKTGLSTRSVQYLHAIARRALEIALRWGVVARNIAKLVEPPRVKRQEVKPLSPEQAKAFLEAARGDRLYALYVVALSLGLRQGELFGIRWENVDLDKGTLQVVAAIQRVGGRPQFVEPKSEKSRRTIALPRFVTETLREHKVRQLEERLVAGSRWQDWGLVFTSTTGTPLEGSNLLKSFKLILRRVGLPDMRFHDLRHSCASLLLAQGLSPRVIMETLGHSQISLTMNTYAHVMPALQREAADAMDRLLGQ